MQRKSKTGVAMSYTPVCPVLNHTLFVTIISPSWLAVVTVPHEVKGVDIDKVSCCSPDGFAGIVRQYYVTANCKVFFLIKNSTKVENSMLLISLTL